MPTAVTWIVAGLLLVLSEFIVPGFLIFFFGVGALLTGCLMLCFGGMPVYLQLLIFAVSSVVLLFASRRFFPKVFGGKERASELPSDDEECAGKMVKVVEAIVPDAGGKVSFQGTEWHAVSDKRHEAGEFVKIIRRDNITMIVE